MKKLSGNEFKEVYYFGILLIVPSYINYLVTTEHGDIVASKDKPDLDPSCGWLYDHYAFSEYIAVVDLEGMDWKETLMEVGK